MSKYYLHDGSENSGPFTIEELKQNKITRNTPIWYEGIDDWKEAGSIDELKSLFPVIPPPIKKATSEKEKQSAPIVKKKSLYIRIYNVFRVLAIIFLVFVAIIIIANFFNKETSDSASYEKSVKTIQEIEATSPLDYLQADGTYNNNFIGDKVKIDGKITNAATVTTYKDVIVKVNFYSKTNTLIGTEDYTLYEFYPPNSTQEFKLKVKAYSNVSSLGWEVVNASVK